ncbi:MAG: hypothetical protein ACRC41_16275 [Sarcina sp.]
MGVNIFRLLETVLILMFGSIGIYLVFGFIYAIIERATSKNLVKKFGVNAVIITGFIGTTVHELSHLLMAKLFCHRVVNVKLFSFTLTSRELGHVTHSYNKKNYYQRIGNFFIGIAPIIGGTIVILLLLRFLLPASWNDIINNFDLNKYVAAAEALNIKEFFLYIYSGFLVIVKSIFAFSNLTTFRFWIFIFILLSITNHMSLSAADFRNSLDGLIFIAILSFGVAIILQILGVKISSVTNILVIYNIFIFSVLLLILILAIIIWGISKVLSFF